LTLFSDEAWFHLLGYISTQNNRYWSSKNPHLTHEALLHPVKVGAWCTLSARIVGPVFFNETINCERYVQVILGQFFSELTEEESLYGWFQEDSAVIFGQHVHLILILAICFWGCLKDKVYSSNPRTEEEKENIHREIANIPAEQLQKVNQNLFRRCKECLRVEGRHFQHLLSSVNKSKNFPSFRTLSAVRHADSSGKFVYLSQQATHRSPWKRSTT
jgi:hypothetical protein